MGALNHVQQHFHWNAVYVGSMLYPCCCIAYWSLCACFSAFLSGVNSGWFWKKLGFFFMICTNVSRVTYKHLVNKPNAVTEICFLPVAMKFSISVLFMKRWSEVIQTLLMMSNLKLLGLFLAPAISSQRDFGKWSATPIYNRLFLSILDRIGQIHDQRSYIWSHGHCQCLPGMHCLSRLYKVIAKLQLG